MPAFRSRKSLPAPGQAALGIEIVADDDDTADLVAELDHALPPLPAPAERTVSRLLGGQLRAALAPMPTGWMANGRCGCAPSLPTWMAVSTLPPRPSAHQTHRRHWASGGGGAEGTGR